VEDKPRNHIPCERRDSPASCSGCGSKVTVSRTARGRPIAHCENCGFLWKRVKKEERDVTEERVVTWDVLALMVRMALLFAATAALLSVASCSIRLIKSLSW
jgi:DNA-directed RNA polymerase subunit RPC12/RpoP